MTSGYLRRRAKTMLGVTGLLALAAAGAGWWYMTSRPDYRLRAGQEALAREDWDAAEQQITHLEADGRADHAHLLRGELFFRQEQFDQALKEFNQIRDQGTIRLQAVAFSGRCLLQLGNRNGAEQAFLFVVHEDPDHVDAHRGLASIYYDQNALDSAIKHLFEVARLDPRDGRPCRLLGLVFKDLEQIPDAVAAYQDALTRELSDRVAEEVREELAECLLKQGAFDEVLRTLDQCEPTPARVGPLRALRAEALWGQGKADGARDLLDRSLADHPRCVELLRLRAKVYLAAEEPKRAADLLERVLEVDRHDHASRFELAKAYEALGRRADAAEQRRLGEQTQKYFTELTGLTQKAMSSPWDAGLHRRLADLCEKLDRPDLAVMHRRAAAACPPLRH
jgi:tetratricopeptide (TPR) repeat protein